MLTNLRELGITRKLQQQLRLDDEGVRRQLVLFQVCIDVLSVEGRKVREKISKLSNYKDTQISNDDDCSMPCSATWTGGDAPSMMLGPSSTSRSCSVCGRSYSRPHL